VPKFSEIGAALATGLGVMWALNKIEIGQFKIPNGTPSTPPPPFTPPTLWKRPGDDCLSNTDPLLNNPNYDLKLICDRGTVRESRVGQYDENLTRPDGKYTYAGYLKFVDSAASYTDYQDYLTGN